MLKILSLSCASCGANLEIKPETESFACGYCGASQSVERSGGTISLKLLTNSIKQVQIGTDKTAAELAIRRLQEEILAFDDRFRLTVAHRKTEMESKNQMFTIILMVSAFVSFFGLASISIIFALVITILVTGAIAYFWHKIKTPIDEKYKSQFQYLKNEREVLYSRLEKQRQIVND